MSIPKDISKPYTAPPPAPKPQPVVSKPPPTISPKKDSWQDKVKSSGMPVLRFDRPLQGPQGQPPSPVEPKGPGGPQGPYKDVANTEFGYPLFMQWNRWGQAGADKIQKVEDKLAAGQSPVVSNKVPQPGDMMVWGPNAGSGATGTADQAGHIGIVQSVTYSVKNGKTYATIRVSEQGWNNKDGVDGAGIPYRDITVPVDMKTGKLSLPDHVGFVGSNPNPDLGPNDTVTDPNFQINHTPDHVHVAGGYNDCVGYIHDIPGYTSTIENLTQGQDDKWLQAQEIPHDGKTPHQGDLIVFDAGSDLINEKGGKAGSQGHVGYVERVTKNYDPPGDPNGKVVSYTITMSEANANGDGDKRSLRTFTVPAKDNGEAQLPTGVGFYSGGSGTASTASTPSNPGTPVTRHQNYTVHTGDTLSSIAARAGVTVDDIVRANPAITNPNVISEGQVIFIP